ncbi:AMP-binding protein [Nesterenkonia marinintestina]|uniref:AMP-binding protein n=1 Tax=Nesterenkonia marinintestina TaxID=2979865 RepID=UPI0021BFA9AF|nr:AMP-binding protein [Nesterenkonia sp. GX14115]
MVLLTSAHHDTFCRDNLPPQEQWPTMEFTLPELHYPDRLNAAEVLIDQAVDAFGADRPALLTPNGERWSYGDLQLRADQVAHVLTQEMGVEPGNRVMLRSPNNPWLVASWLGVLKAGAVAVTTMPVLRPAEVQKLVDLTRPTVLLTDHRFVDGLTDEVTEVPVVTIGGGGPEDLVSRAGHYRDPFQAVETSQDDVALLAPTSGSTGAPKVTMHFHRDVLANADTFARHILRPAPDDVFAGSPPLAFTFGLGGLVVFPLRFGASALLTERVTPVELAELVAEHTVTVLFTAPTAYRAIIREGCGDRLRGLRLGVSAGEHLPESTWHEVQEHTGLTLINGIGATELLHVFISTTQDEPGPGTTGRPIPGFRAKIVDEMGQDVPDGEQGRLAVIGPTGCRYLADDRQSVYVQDGWNITGDTFVRTADGSFVYQARSDSMIISSGYNISAPEVEEALSAHDDVLECAVVAKPDEDRGSVVCAFVVLRDGVEGDDVLRRSLQDHVKSTIAPYKYPRDVRFVDELPKNPSGKLQHFKLRGQLQAS